MEKVVVDDNFAFLMRLEYLITLHFFGICLYSSNKPSLHGLSMSGLLCLVTQDVLSKTLGALTTGSFLTASNLLFCN